MKVRKGFTLVELMVVVLIVGILAAVAIPMMRGRVDDAKWTEANAAAGTIRTAIRALYAQDDSAATALVGSNLGVTATREALGFAAGDLEGTYFSPSNYTITSVSTSTTTEGMSVITVSGQSKSGAPSGSRVLALDGSFNAPSE